MDDEFAKRSTVRLAKSPPEPPRKAVSCGSAAVEARALSREAVLA
jgi:hypothetical protein